LPPSRSKVASLFLLTNRLFVEKTFLEFFAGIGLMRIGLENEGWGIRFANDIDPGKQSMYSHHFQDSADHFILGDIHHLETKKLPIASLATASFPCNDLSLAGARAGLKGAQSSAYWGFTQILDKLGRKRPPMVLLENVAGFLTSNHGQDLEAALLELNRLGYAVDVFIINADHFVPQSRQRLFVVGSRQPESNEELAEPVSSGFYSSEIRPPALAQFIFDHPLIRWEIRSLPYLPERTKILTDVLDNVSSTSPEWWDEDRTLYLLNQMSEKHRTTIESMRVKSTYSYGTVFRRVRNGRSMAELRTDGVAGCLRTPRGGSGRQILVRAGRDSIKARLLNGRECARLMGADDFKLNVRLNQALFGFGDAVCVDVISWIAHHYLNPLFKELSCETRPMQRIA